MNIQHIIQNIDLMDLSEEEKAMLKQSLTEKGEEALLEVLTYLKLKVKNYELAAKVLETEGEDLAEMWNKIEAQEDAKAEAQPTPTEMTPPVVQTAPVGSTLD